MERGRGLARNQSKTPVVSNKEYLEFVRAHSGEFGLGELRIRIVAQLMFEEQLPLFPLFIQSVVSIRMVL